MTEWEVISIWVCGFQCGSVTSWIVLRKTRWSIWYTLKRRNNNNNLSLFISRFIYYNSTSKRQTSVIYGPDPKGKCRIGYLSPHFSAFFSVAHHLFFSYGAQCFTIQEGLYIGNLDFWKTLSLRYPGFIYLSQIKTTSRLRYVSQCL